MNRDAIIAELEANYDISESAREYLRIVEEEEEAERMGPLVSAGKFASGALWHHLKTEIFELLCKGSSKYSRERQLAKHSVAPIVSLLSSSLTSIFGVEAGFASGLAAAALLIPLKVSVNVWCAAAKVEIGMTPLERKALRHLGRRPTNGKSKEP